MSNISEIKEAYDRGLIRSISDKDIHRLSSSVLKYPSTHFYNFLRANLQNAEGGFTVFQLAKLPKLTVNHKEKLFSKSRYKWGQSKNGKAWKVIENFPVEPSKLSLNDIYDSFKKMNVL